METDQQTLTPEPLPFRWKMAWVAVFLFLWAAGLSLQNPGLMADDSGEMVAAAACLGLPHPPGYPLSTLLGHLACGIPLGSPAFRMNLLSLMALWIAVWVTLGTCRRVFTRMFRDEVGRSGWICETVLVGAALSFFFTRHVLAQALTAKGFVYTLTLCILSSMIERFSAQEGRPTFATICCVMALWSLGLANHWQTQVLWVPVLLLMLLSAGKNIPVRGWVTTAALSIVGISVYLVLPLRSQGHPLVCWGDASHLDSFWWILSRKLVSSTEGHFRPLATYWSFLKGFLSTLSSSSSPVFYVLALVGCVGALLRRMRGAFYAVVLYVPSTLAVLFYAREEVFYLVSVYMVAMQGLITIGAVVGMGLLLERFKGRSRWSAGVVGIWLLTTLLWIPHACRTEDKSRYTLTGDLGFNILQALPKDSFFLAEGDLSVFPIWYDQAALGLRPDIAIVPPHFFLHPWGWDQAVRMRPALGKRDLSLKAPAIQWTALRRAFGGSPVGMPGGLYLSMDRTKLLAYDPGWVRGAIPAGLVLSASTQPESDRAFLERQREIHRHRRLRTVEGPEGSRSLDFVSRQILRYYADDSFQDALWLESRGDLWNSMAFFDTGFQIDPDEPSAYSGVARVLGKAGYPEVSVDLCRKGLSLAPQEKVLQNNLLFSIHLAAMERSEGKTDRYEGLLREARTLHWGYLFRIFKGTADRLAAERGRTQHDGI